MAPAKQLLYMAARAIAVLGATVLAADAVFTPTPTVAQELTMRVAGQQRTYILARPNASGPLPTFIFLHGKGGSGAKAQRMGFEQLGEREQFVTVLPDGLGGSGTFFHQVSATARVDSRTAPTQPSSSS
jgi:poly(3-hydroxybutyrate) depolymerase